MSATLLSEMKRGAEIMACALDDIVGTVRDELEGVASDLEGTLDADDVPGLSDAIDRVRRLAAQFEDV